MKGKIFNAQEVQAIILGNKTQFREVIKPQPFDKCHFVFDKETNLITQIAEYSTENHKVCVEIDDSHSVYLKCPYQVGQKIFCKESFSTARSLELHETQQTWYWSTGNPYCGDWGKPKPAQHMKQEHSRLTLQIKEIRVERLTDIEEDAIAEGFKNTFVGFQHPVYNPGRTANQDFEVFWNSTHKKPEEKFEANPWVWCVSFEVINN